MWMDVREGERGVYWKSQNEGFIYKKDGGVRERIEFQKFSEE